MSPRFNTFASDGLRTALVQQEKVLLPPRLPELNLTKGISDLYQLIKPEPVSRLSLDNICLFCLGKLIKADLTCWFILSLKLKSPTFLLQTENIIPHLRLSLFLFIYLFIGVSSPPYQIVPSFPLLSLPLPFLSCHVSHQLCPCGSTIHANFVLAKSTAEIQGNRDSCKSTFSAAQRFWTLYTFRLVSIISPIRGHLIGPVGPHRAVIPVSLWPHEEKEDSETYWIWCRFSKILRTTFLV